MRCLSVFREITNSPNRENDDALILKAVCDELIKLGVKVHLIEPDVIDDIIDDKWDLVVPMCENPVNLNKIKKINAVFFNTVESVYNCYRLKMFNLIMKSCPDIFPKTIIRPMSDFPGEKPDFFSDKGVWVKRGDVHNTCLHDVHYVKRWDEAEKVRDDFATRRIKDVIIQEHIQGDLIKFYGVGPGKWFDWFYHKPTVVKKYKFNVEDLHKNAVRFANAVGVEIYGGDAIVTEDSKIYIIDINSWPSFARVRDVVKKEIAKHIYEKMMVK
ncbi:MAG: hypothetical protein KA059_01185 [Elusimicrobiales bacterium]|nr:hypothetical protein [Elusimicrobiales bacterium]